MSDDLFSKLAKDKLGRHDMSSVGIGHERTHVWQVKTYGYPEEDALARRMEDAAKATEAQWWDYYQMNQRR